MTKKEIAEKTVKIRESYSSYKIADIAVQLYLHNVSQEDIDYIMQDGKDVKAKPYDKHQAILAGIMDRMEEHLPAEVATKIRRDSACCLTGKRETLARAICNNNATIEERFAALSNERNIIGGKGWKEGEDYFISYWWGKPARGYTCACVKHIPEKPMNKLWCECCVGHIKHHFDTALGVESTCQCIASALTSCGEQPCTFKFSIVKVFK